MSTIEAQRGQATKATMNGGEAVVATLREEGIEHVFGIVASSILEIFNLLPRAGLTYVGVRHEQVAAHMADGYARVSGRPAVCLVQNGGGVTNLTTGFGTALKAHSPVIGISGTPGVSELDRDTFQELDQLTLMKPVTKWTGRVPAGERIAEYLRTAVRTALTPPMGPVFLEIPRNFLYDVHEVEIQPRRSHRVSSRGAADQESVAAAAELLLAAERPVIIAGGGVVWSGATAATADIAELLRAPLVTSYQHNDAVPSDHPWALGSLGRAGSRAAMDAIAQADVVLALGSRLANFSLMPYYGKAYFPTAAKIVQVDVDPARIGVYRPVELGIAADAAVFAAQLSETLADRDGRSVWSAAEVEELRRSWRDEWMSRAGGEDSPLRIEQVFAELREVIPPDAIVTTDVGGTPSYAFHMLDFSRPRTLVSPMLFGSLGCGLGLAMGARIASGDSPVVALLGDGALTMSLPALITAAEYGIAFVAIVFDNGCWGAEKVNQTYFNDREYVGTVVENPDLAAVAAAMGLDAYAVSSRSEIGEAVTNALAGGGPAAVVIRVDPDSLPEPARKDALKTPFRGLFGGKA